MIEKMYQTYYDLLLCYCMSMTKAKAQAEDITQETFIRAMEHIDLLEAMPEYKCKSWLYTTARHIFIDEYRRIAKAPKENEEVFWEDDLSQVMVCQVCGCLDPLEQNLFRLRYMEGYNASELGEMYHMSPSTVRAKLSHARKMVAKAYNH